MIISGKKGGKSLAQRAMVLAAVADGRVVHVAGWDGLWRVMPTGIGPLWEKIRQPCPASRIASAEQSGRRGLPGPGGSARSPEITGAMTAAPDCHPPALPSPCADL